jgi:hypothetical protein
MGEGIGADHCLVGLNHEASRLADHAAGGQNVLGRDADIQAEIVAARLHGHDHFFQ